MSGLAMHVFWQKGSMTRYIPLFITPFTRRYMTRSCMLNRHPKLLTRRLKKLWGAVATCAMCSPTVALSGSVLSSSGYGSVDAATHTLLRKKDVGFSCFESIFVYISVLTVSVLYILGVSEFAHYYESQQLTWQNPQQEDTRDGQRQQHCSPAFLSPSSLCPPYGIQKPNTQKTALARKATTS